MQQVKIQWDVEDVQVTAQVAVLAVVPVALAAATVPVVLLAEALAKPQVESINSTFNVADVPLCFKRHICIGVLYERYFN